MADNNAQFKQKVDVLKKEIAKTTEIMHENIELTLARGDKLEEMSEKTTILEQESRKFKKSATSLKRQMCWNNWKYTIIIAIIVLIVLIVCGLLIYAATKK
jgi:hypothetical protein